MSTATANELKDGRVVAIAGPVVDVEFPPDALPEINALLEMDIVLEGETITVAAEVAQQIGEGRVRVICMKPTDGLKRGTVVRNTGHGIQMPFMLARNAQHNVLAALLHIAVEPLRRAGRGPDRNRGRQRHRGIDP